MNTAGIIVLVSATLVVLCCCVCIVFVCMRVSRAKLLRKEMRREMRERSQAAAVVEKQKVDMVLLTCTSTTPVAPGHECSICLAAEEEEDPAEWVAIPGCAHTTHTACMRTWIATCLHKENLPVCPLCRTALTPPDEVVAENENAPF
eukprot:TRINITY_DN9957_c2_g1_i1.p1 TRINITY_DN9957_c2_g1~~TRINITY_DN9957_c2_g1_i1.p1  ORF type:complete len:147 (+),score=37.66 TRINITY_DN9957_c2_g1_i1:61-501(+)